MIVVIAIVVPVAVTTSRNKSSDNQAISPLSSVSSTLPSSTPVSSSAPSPSSTPVDSQGFTGDSQSDSGVSSGKTEQGSSDDGAFEGSSPVSGG